MTEDEVQLRLADEDDAPSLLALIRTSFAARRPVDPPPAALKDGVEDVARRIRECGGVVASIGGAPVGCLLMSSQPDDTLMVHRVSVLPGHQHEGVASALVRGAGEWAADQGKRRIQLMARSDLPELVSWWQMHGFTIDHAVEGGYILARMLPVSVTVPSAEDMRALGRALAARMRAGDLLVANGELGAGKTTLAQGLGAGLRVQGPIISPTFVLARIHRSLGEGLGLVHVDAYRMGSAAELEDIDLDSSMADSVTLVEWGAGLAEGLSRDHLDIDIVRSEDPDDDTRTVYLSAHGPRWETEDLYSLRREVRPDPHEDRLASGQPEHGRSNPGQEAS
ncbi:tRNA threonylcarbamoyladenosine biosynthesis protein TsaE [Propionibacterium cyclohexanicum]|uniref:tRNA threonylcarbamoyladenosine biosynthesis protein TsaE n=1 Tax=Propionibacterium cyclohexanicum TaxID=64702 RepID=A0A1H9S7H8_9ACTN|nr:tRNA threonylcarbamoyladenosine biosynthesis protein TsaE [Propionibacterium cyclohexanicum]